MGTSLLLLFDPLRWLNSIVLILLFAASLTSTFATFYTLNRVSHRFLGRFMHNKLYPIRSLWMSGDRWLFWLSLWRCFLWTMGRWGRFRLFMNVFAWLFGRVIAGLFQIWLTDIFQVVTLGSIFVYLWLQIFISFGFFGNMLRNMSRFLCVFASDSAWLDFAVMMTFFSSLNSSRGSFVSLPFLWKSWLIKYAL